MLDSQTIRIDPGLMADPQRMPSAFETILRDMLAVYIVSILGLLTDGTNLLSRSYSSPFDLTIRYHRPSHIASCRRHPTGLP